MSASPPTGPNAADPHGAGPPPRVIARDSMLQGLVCTVVIALLLAAFNRVVMGPVEFAIVPAMGAIACSASLLLARQGRAEAAAHWLVLALWVTLNATMWAHRGMHDISLVAVPGLVISAGLLLPRGRVVLLLAATAVSLAFLGLAEMYGWVVSPLSGDTTPVVVMQVIVIVLASGMVGLLIEARLDASMRRALEAGTELRATNAALAAQAQALRISEARYRTMFDRSPAAIAEWDPRLRVRAWSASAERIFGHSREAAAGLPMSELFPPAGRAAVDALAASPRDGAARFSTVHANRRADGATISCRWFVAPLLDDAGGLAGLASFVEDVTDTVHAEQALRESEATFLTVFRESPIAMAIASADDFRFVEVNPQFERLTGWPRDEAIGRSGIELGMVDANDAIATRRRIQAGESVADRTLTLHRRDGTARLVRTSGIAQRVGERECFVWYGNDVTEMSQARRTIDANAAEQQRRESFLRRQFDIAERFLRGDALSGDDPGAAFRTITEAGGRELAVRRSGIWLLDDDRRTLRCVDEFDLEAGHWVPPPLSFDEHPALLAVLTNERVFAVADAGVDPRLAELRSTLIAARGTGAFLDVSLIQQGRFVGVMCNEHVGGPREWTVEERSFAATLSDFVLIAIETRERRESEAKFARLFQSSPLALSLSARGDRRLVDVNDAWLRLFGHEREHAVGRTPAELSLWVDPDVERELVWDADLRDDPLEARVESMRTADGSVREIELTGSRILALGSGAYRIWSYADVTDVRRAQREVRTLNASLEDKVRQRTAELTEALDRLRRAQGELVRTEKLVALGSIVAGVAHELNTPIGNALTVASTLEEKSEEFAREVLSGAVRRSSLASFTEACREASRLVMRSLAQAAELVRSFKQVAVDQTSENRRLFDLARTIEEVLTTLQHRLREVHVRLETDLAPGVLMDGYPGPLGQVVSNLFNNALAHAFEGREQGRIAIRARREGESEARIEFSDDGLGIDRVNLERIFDPFFTTKLGRGGSGLGLNIVHNIVTELLGGRIAVESQPGTGTRFTIVLPLAAPRRSPPGIES